MIRIGEYLCGLVLILLMVPVFLIGMFVAVFDIRHYIRNRQM